MSKLIPSHVCEALRKIVKSDIDNFEVILPDQNKKGEGYLGNILFITLRHKETGKTFDFVVKQALTGQQLRDSVPVRDLYGNEIFFYSKIFPEFDKFQERIKPAHQFKTVPNFFASIFEENCETLILENLKKRNFELYDKKIPFDKEHFELILKQFGKFHGLSFAYRYLYPEEFERLGSKLINVFSNLEKIGFFSKGVRSVYEVCLKNLQPGRDDELIKKFKPYVENFEEILEDNIRNKSKYTAIIQGDCWSNNMMFKYDENRKLVDMRILDFQGVRNASPCIDLSYCIYTGASREILQNLNYYLQVYYSSLSSTIGQFGCDPDRLYPMEQFQKDFKLHCNFGLTMALMVWKVKCSYEEGLLDLQDGGDEASMFETPYDEEAFNTISRDLLNHFYENDFFKSV